MHEERSDVRLELGHVLFIDIVSASRLLINEQSETLRRLNEIVRNTAEVRSAEAGGKLTRLPTGDGMALAFFTTPDAPLRCAIEIAKALKQSPIALRMGIHSGPVEEVLDVNERANLAGAGINIAQRVMDCGDAGHILLSERIADDLAQYATWRSGIHQLGRCEVKHGDRIGIANFYTAEIGNAALPKKLSSRATSERAGSWRAPALIGVSVLIIALALAAFFHWRNLSSAPERGQKRIAVLPFKPLVAENRDPVLELGMADSLIAKLSNTRALVVSSINSVRKFSALDQDAIAAGRELRVDSILEGNVQRAADRIRVSARLVNVADSTALWSETFDEKFTDVFAVQDAISQKVADALALRLSGEQKSRLQKRYTDNLEAYQLYLTGRYRHSKLIPSEIRSAIASFQEAIARDPTYALAYFGLAECYRSLAITSDVPSKDSLPQAKDAALKALAIDDGLAEAHASLSFSLIWYDWDWPGGLREAQRAVSLNSNSGFSHFAYAHVLSDLGQHEQALREAHQAAQLEPVYPLIRALEGMFLHHARRDDDAARVLREALQLNPDFWVACLTLGKVYAAQGKYAEAIEEFTKARSVSHDNSEAIGSIGYTAALAGDKARAEQILEEMKTMPAQHYIPPCNLALVYVGLGEKNQALTQLERALEEHDVRLSLLKVDPRWDSLRSEARFTAILKRVGLQ